MAEQLFFSRDSKLYLELDNTVWEIPILDGFSFSQATNQTEISLSEMQGSDGLSRRGNRLFTDSLAPAEWSFSTYVRPYKSTEHGAVEEALWAVMAGADKYKVGSAGGGIATISDQTSTQSGNLGGITDGTYTINDEDTTAGTHGAGAVGWEIDVVIASNAVSSITVISAGSGFSANDTITMTGANLQTSKAGQTGGSGTLHLRVDTVTTEGASFYRGSQADENSSFGPAVVEPTATSSIINFGQSNRSTLGTCNLFFVMETAQDTPMVYKLSNAAVNEASIDFEVDGIATINWSGFAKTITDMQSAGDVTVNTSAPATSGGTAAAGKVHIRKSGGASPMLFSFYPTANTPVTAIRTAVDNTSTFIRNRLTQLLVEEKGDGTTPDTTAFPSTNYNLTLTGGNITISNNISYLVPEELGAVNVPIEHVTGGRTASGSFTCYLTLETNAGNNGTSVELFNDMTNSATGGGLSKVVNNFDVTFQIGGSTGTPRLNVTMPKVHINVPTHSIEDVISVETSFGAYTDDFNVANEVQLEYIGPAV